MPNHVLTRVHCDDPSVLDKYLNKDGDFDFEMIFPRHPKLYDGQPHEDLVARAKNTVGIPIKDRGELLQRMEMSNRFDTTQRAMRPEDWPELQKMVQSYLDTGFVYWYDWNIAHYGTKWCNYSVSRPEPNIVQYQTAWSFADKVIQELSKRHPEATFTCAYADEDYGSNCGVVVYKAGILEEANRAPRYDEVSSEERAKWERFAVELWGRYSWDEYQRECEE